MKHGVAYSMPNSYFLLVSARRQLMPKGVASTDGYLRYVQSTTRRDDKVPSTLY
ncbi:Protein of unknown function [Pyronema omphalodes CBS 100304]|uniref:Uncharacterized protein n=1 Tax=Pyronema omphalodes (strain CBS 100304) TaxID=1076935 RepID=U4LD55_PYROM|nr:Protein of unknown function [Pyronema omphalodes CBS 100304]